MADVKVPYLDLKAQYRSIKPEIDAAIASVLESCQFALGPEVAAFERDFPHAWRVRDVIERTNARANEASR